MQRYLYVTKSMHSSDHARSYVCTYSLISPPMSPSKCMKLAFNGVTLQNEQFVSIYICTPHSPKQGKRLT
jgi:hypothetical protein